MAGRIRVDVMRYGRTDGGKTLAVTVGETTWEEFIDLAAKRLGLNHQPPSSVVYALSAPSEDSTEEPKYLSSLAEISHGDLVQLYQWDEAELAKASTTPRTTPGTTPRTAAATPRAITPRMLRWPEEDGDDIPPPPPPPDDDDDIPPPPPPPPPPELSPRQASPASPSTQEAPKWRGFQLRPREGPPGFTLRSLPLGASTSSPALGSLLSSLSASTSPSSPSSSSSPTSESPPAAETNPGNSIADSASTPPSPSPSPSSPTSTDTTTSTTSQDSPSPTRPPNSPSRSNWLTPQKENRSPTLQRSSTQPLLGRRQTVNLTQRSPATPTPSSPLGGRGGIVLSAAIVSSAAKSVVRPPSMKVLTFDVFYFSVFQTNDNSHVLLELDCKQQTLRRWRKEKPLPPVPFSEIASHSTSPAAGSTVTLQLQFKTQPGGVFHVLSAEEADNLSYVLNCIQMRLFSVIGEKKPRLCIKKGFVNIERKGLMKKSSSMYVVITDKKVFGFASEDMMLPLVAIDLRGATVSKRKGSDIVIDYKQFKQLTFTFSLEPMRDFWYDSLTRAIEITDSKIYELQQLMDDVRQFYGLPYENEDPEHVALLQDLWDLTISLNPDKAQLTFNPRRSDHWKLIGFQREDPVSDLRAVGLLGLKHLIYLARHYPELFKEQVEKQNSSNSAEMEYPFATVGINITYLLVDIFKLAPEKPLPLPLSETYPIWFYHPRAFDELYCLTFRLFDRIWLEMMVGYMGFQKVIDRTKDRLVELLGRPPVQGVPAIFDMLGVILDTNTR